MNIASKSIYREYRPPTALINRIICFWTQEVFGTEIYLQSVLPDGCMDIVWIGQKAPILVGPATRTVIANLPGGSDIIGVRFFPGCASPILGGLSADEIVNQGIPLDAVWNFGAHTMTTQLLQCKGLPAKLDTLTHGIGALFESAPVVDPLVQFCTAWLKNHTASRIGELAKSAGYSERHLLRRFSTAVGYSPKTFQRIMRLQKLSALSNWTQESKASLASLALNLGYSDQAHMCRDIRSLAGISPLELLQNGSSNAMSDLFNSETTSAVTIYE